MITNHDEVYKYWCPMARVTDDNIGSMNRYFSGPDSKGDLGPGGVFCLGNKCMAWRWLVFEKQGYCGLAGKPETQ